MKLEIKRTRGRQPWRWKLLYDNGEPASNSGEPFPDERCVSLAVYRYLHTHESAFELAFRGAFLPPSSWHFESEATFARKLMALIRTLPPKPVRNRSK